MSNFSQGDIIKISGFKVKFLIISKNSFLRTTGLFHVCPILENVPEGPVHIKVTGKNKECGIVVCEQIKIIDPTVRNCSKADSLPYADIMNVSDTIQGIFEYD